MHLSRSNRTRNSRLWIRLLENSTYVVRRKFQGRSRPSHRPNVLNGAVCQQHGNAVNDGIVAPAALTPYGGRLKQQWLMADGADEPAQLLCRQCACAHASILANSLRKSL